MILAGNVHFLAILKSEEIGTGELFVAKLFDPLVIGNLTLRNRIVMPPMTNGLADTFRLAQYRL